MQATVDSRPIHRVYVDAFWMDATEVTNGQFAAFVAATKYITVAERTPTLEEFPGAPPENLVAGSMLFAPPNHPVPLDDHLQWWTHVKGAEWRHPLGPHSSIDCKDNQPVVLDNGLGFAEPAVSAHGIGIRGMQERVRLLGGTLKLQSRPVVDGTRLTVTVPHVAEAS